jgi:hypothetical protein
MLICAHGRDGADRQRGVVVQLLQLAHHNPP